MSSKNTSPWNQIGFALEILRLLAQKSQKKSELMLLLGERGFADGDLGQKITRTITKLRSCGFEIKSAPNQPYKLVTSDFPVIITEEQRQALAMACELLASLGFSAEAGHIYRIANWENRISHKLTTDFHPPTNYSEDKIQEVVQDLQNRIGKKRRFVVWYRSRNGNDKQWDLDKSELRLHNGVLYLFSIVPSFIGQHIHKTPNPEQNCTLRVDRIARVGSSSQIPWTYTKFPTLKIQYRLTGNLANYKPRRPHEKIISPPDKTEHVDIETQDDCIFWFHQRILQYGANARVLQPDWLVKMVMESLNKAHSNYQYQVTGNR
jgi:predicted DNA-binding transcriptional regulator YafY